MGPATTTAAILRKGNQLIGYRRLRCQVRLQDRSVGIRNGVWTHGQNTEFEAWIEDESRVVVVTREAIEDHLALKPEEAAAMTAPERVDFVSDNLQC